MTSNSSNNQEPADNAANSSACAFNEACTPETRTRRARDTIQHRKGIAYQSVGKVIDNPDDSEGEDQKADGTGEDPKNESHKVRPEQTDKEEEKGKPLQQPEELVILLALQKLLK